MDLNNLNELREHIVDTKNFTRKIDDDDVSFCYKKSPMIFDWKSEGFTVEDALIGDILNWLCYLGLGDGYIADEEVEFINYCLDLNYNKEMIHDMASSKSNVDFKNNIPISFIFFCEAEIVDKKLIMSHSVPVYSINLIGLFDRLGESFIGCDGEITSDEKNCYYNYMQSLWQNLTDFKLRRGIDETFDNLVGRDVLEKNITVKTNLNKRTADKMNLVLKLLSQGYSLYDLNNIACISTNIITKWFFKGSLGDKNFEDFYSKCIKINPILEVDIEYVMENVDIDDIDDELYDNSKSQIIKTKTHSKPKNNYYKLQIDELKSKFQLKEEHTRELIEKCFPAPQITNSKFNSIVDECSKIFFNKVENGMIILHSTKINSNKLENEVRQNLSVLKELMSELDSLHEELLIHVSKLGDNDVENILEDMGRLIDSVKDY